MHLTSIYYRNNKNKKYKILIHLLKQNIRMVKKNKNLYIYDLINKKFINSK